MNHRIIIAAALAVCACTPIRTDMERYAINCPAKEISLQSDSLEFPYSAYFNTRGQLDSVVTRNFDGSFRYLETYSYNSSNQLEEIEGLNADNENEARYEYEIDGKFIRECRVYGMNNQEIHRWVHKNNGRHIVHTDYYNEGELQYVTDKAFSGNTYTEESHTPEGELLGRAEVEFFKSDTKPSRITGDGIDVEIRYGADGLPVMSRNTVLNSFGEMEWVPDLETNPCRWYSYEYDERGNWISRAERKDPEGAVTAVLRRTIIY